MDGQNPAALRKERMKILADARAAQKARDKKARESAQGDAIVEVATPTSERPELEVGRLEEAAPSSGRKDRSRDSGKTADDSLKRRERDPPPSEGRSKRGRQEASSGRPPKAKGSRFGRVSDSDREKDDKSYLGWCRSIE